MARWGANGLLNTRGELFISEARHIPPELPRLSGPRGTEAEVASRYLAAQGQLIEAGMRLTRCGSMRAAPGNSISTTASRCGSAAGRSTSASSASWPPRSGRSRARNDIDYVDMRYTNGFAIGWRAGGQRVASGTAEDDNSDG